MLYPFTPIANVRDNQIYVFDDQEYFVEILLDNGVDDLLPLPLSFVDQLILDQDIHRFWTMGRLDYYDPNYTLNRFSELLEDNIEGCEALERFKYNFTGNGKEMLHIKMKPIIRTDSEEGPIIDAEQNERLLDKIWLHQQSYIIYKIETIDALSFNDQKKGYKLFFYDYEYHILSTRQIEFNCGREGGNVFRNEEFIQSNTLKNLPDYPKVADENPTRVNGDRIDDQNAKALKTGEAIYSIIAKTIADEKIDQRGEDGIIVDPLPRLDLERSQSQRKYVLRDEELEKRDNELVKEQVDVWDWGPETSRIFKNTGTNQKAIDLLEHFLFYHVAEKQNRTINPNRTGENAFSYDPCILRLNKGRSEFEDRKFTLTSFIHFFERCGDTEALDYYLENFFVKEEGSPNNNNDSESLISDIMRIIQGNCDFNRAMNVAIPIEPNFTPINGLDSNTFFNSAMVSKYSSLYKLFSISGNTTTLQDIKDHIANNYVLNMRTFEQDVRENVIINTNEDKKEYKNVMHKHNFLNSFESTIAIGRNPIIRNIVFLNNAVHFTTRGSLNREPSRFFGIDKPEKSTTNSTFEDKHYGQYWATRVIHKFNFHKKEYTNDMVGVKFYTYSKDKDDIDGFDN